MGTTKMITLETIYNKVAKWNSDRYTRVYSHELTFSLLEEEATEYFTAESDVERLDALCDICYVAMGGLWKLGLSEKEHEFTWHEAIEQVNMLNGIFIMEPIHAASSLITLFNAEDFDASMTAVRLHAIISLCQFQMSLMDLSPFQHLEALNVVCISNATKSIKKTDASIKANAGDKGAYYVSPTAGLLAILEARETCDA